MKDTQIMSMVNEKIEKIDQNRGREAYARDDQGIDKECQRQELGVRGIGVSDTKPCSAFSTSGTSTSSASNS